VHGAQEREWRGNLENQMDNENRNVLQRLINFLGGKNWKIQYYS
jgi:hypothetical protein